MSERYEGRTNIDERRGWGRSREGDDWSNRTGRDEDRGRWNEMDEDRGYDPRRFGGYDDRGRMGDRWRGISEERRGMFEDRNRNADSSFNRGYDDSYDLGYGGGSMASGYGRDSWGSEGTFRRDFGPGYDDDRFRGGGMSGGMGRGMMGRGMMGQGGFSGQGGSQGGSMGYQGGYQGQGGYGGYQSQGGGYQGQGRGMMGSQTRGFQGGYQGDYQGQMNQGPYAGKGPKGYTRNYDRVREDVNEALARHPQIDASEIEVQVDKGEVTLTGTVNERNQKRLAEMVVEQVDGVSDVHNQLRVILMAGDRSQQMGGGNGGEQRMTSSMPGMGPGGRNPQQPTQPGTKKRTDQD